MKTAYQFTTDENCHGTKGPSSWGVVFATREECAADLARTPRTYKGVLCVPEPIELSDAEFSKMFADTVTL